MQLQRYQEIQLSKESRDHVEIARAKSLKKAEDGGVTIKAPRGNRSQWHSNFRLDEFAPCTRDLPVVQKEKAADEHVVLRGLLVVGPGHTLADCCKMLLTELQLGPTSGWWELSAIDPRDGTVLASYDKTPTSAEMLPLLPSGSFYLLVGNCPPPRCVQVDAPPQTIFHLGQKGS